MQFHDFAESLLGSKVKVKLIRHLLAEETISCEREIAKLLRVSHSAVNKSLRDFYEQNLIKPVRVGNVKIWHLNKESYAYQFLTSFDRWIKISPLEHLKSTIKSCLGHLTFIKKVIIFGSIAEGKELPNSDIDLFILVEKDEDRKNVLYYTSNLNETCLKVYGNKLSTNIFTYKDQTNPKNKKFLENVSKGIIVIER